MISSTMQRHIALLPADAPEVASKRSVTIAGHSTSIRIEPVFWKALVAHAVLRGLPLNALVAQIDVWRLGADAPAPNLASAIRQWVFLQSSPEGRQP